MTEKCNVCDIHHEVEFEHKRSLNEVSIRLDSHGKGIREIGQMVNELRGILLGDDKQKGLLHKVNDTIDSFATHMKESEEYRPKILASYAFVSKMQTGISTAATTIITTIAQVATMGMLAILLWKSL